MAPNRAQKVVVRSTRKVVQQSVQVSAVGSSKRTTRGSRDIQTSEEVGTLGQENVRIIPVQEVTPQAKEDASTTTITTEDKGEQENNPNAGAQYQTEEQKKDTTAIGAQKEESKEHEKKAKTHEGNDSRGKRKKKRGRSSGEGYRRYVYRVLKQVHPDMGISSQAMTVLNNLMSDMFERLADEAAKLKTYTGHMTLSSREIQGAVKLVLPGELGKHAIAEGAKAVTNYISHDA